MSRAVLICGATGKQGGAVLNRLVKQNADFKILAVTRNANSPSAQRLLSKSPKVKLVQGDLADPAALFKTARSVTDKPIWGVFSVQVRVFTPFLTRTTTYLFHTGTYWLRSRRRG
jgi:nucleoside-diphosphate-sugar epimerase